MNALKELFQAVEEFEAGEVLFDAELQEIADKHYQKSAKLLKGYFDSEDSLLEGDGKEIIHSLLTIIPDARERLGSFLASGKVVSRKEMKANVEQIKPIIHEAKKVASAECKSVAKKHTFVKEGLIFFGLLISIYLVNMIVNTLYHKVSFERVDGEQLHYADFSDTTVHGLDPVYWVELGRDGVLFAERVSEEGFSVEVKDFTIGYPWRRNVFWHITAGDKGSIRVQFPKRLISKIAIFMTDGDTYWRISRVQSQAADELATELHDGKWIIFNLSEMERQLGFMDISFTRLTGNSISVSAIAAF
jgi:hypothetical protein